MKQIVLIDDDRDDAELFKEALEEINPTVGFEYYEDSKHALHELVEKNEPSLPDLIFLDINMPIVSGWQCLDEFKKTTHLKDIPVVIFTTSSQPAEKERAHQLGATGFITKPSEYKQLRAMISSFVPPDDV